MAPRTSSRNTSRARIGFGGGARRRATLALAFALVVFASLVLSGCSSAPKAATPEPAATTPQPAQTAPASKPTADATALKIEDIKVGTGAEAKSGDKVTVNYTGYLTDGTKFDSSIDSGQPFKFTIGAGEVIPGWDQGFTGMKVGGKRKLTIPPDLGYGAQGAGNGVIPPNATLVFDVELLAVN